MKNKFKILAIAIVAVMFASCEKETISQLDAGTKTKSKTVDSVKFTTQILPILQNGDKCFGCHDGGTPDFAGDRNTVYTALTIGKLKSGPALLNIANPSASGLYTTIVAPGGHNGMSVTDADMFLLWIQQGAKNN